MDDPADPCAYVPLANYDWQIVPLLSGRRGACNGITLAWNPTVVCLFVALHAVAVWTALGINIQAMIMFKRWTSVYFCAVILTSCAIIVQTIVTDLMLFTTFGDMLVLDSVLFPIADVLSGFGFLLVLWSRLHQVMDCPKLLRILLVLIVVIAVPLRIIIILSAIGPPPDRHRPRWGLEVWQVMYRLEMLIPVLDILLACLYIYLFMNRFASSASERRASRRTLILLIVGELFVIAGDAAIMGIWFAGIFLIRWAIGPFLYALKLLVEFLILNSLTTMGERSLELRHLSSVLADEAVSSPEFAVVQSPALSQAANEKPQDDRMVVHQAGAGQTGTERAYYSDQTDNALEKTTSLDVWAKRYLGRGLA